MEDYHEQFFDILWNTHAEGLHRYARAILKNSALEEEAVQDTFLIALRRLDKIKTHPNPGGWLMNTLKNVILQKVEAELRQSRCFPYSEPAEDVGLDEVLPPRTSKNDRRILTLYYVDGYPIAEISAILGASVAKCKIDLYRARNRLKETLSHEPCPRGVRERGGGQNVPEK